MQPKRKEKKRGGKEKGKEKEKGKRKKEKGKRKKEKGKRKKEKGKGKKMGLSHQVHVSASTPDDSRVTAHFSI